MTRKSESGIKIPGYLLDSGEFSDVAFICNQRDGAEKRIPVHKMILALNSPVFKSMFYGALKEQDDVCITDASAEGFSEFLQLFYTTDVKFTIDNIDEVISLIDKYDVADGFKSVEWFLLSSVTPENVCTFYEILNTHDFLDI